jgi:gamma-glutamylcyclotransferase
MCSGRLRDYKVSLEGSGEPARLEGYRLLFNKKSGDGSGKANVEPSADDEVWGVVYSIPDSDLGLLDDGERGYGREQKVIRHADGTLITAWVYIAVASCDRALRPFGWYKRFLVEGATEHALPRHYISKLESVEFDEDVDRNRDKKKRALRCKTLS